MASSEASVLQHKHDHIHVDSDHCPWCDQPITHEKFKEIQSRIQREERERAPAVEQRLKRDQEAALKAKGCRARTGGRGSPQGGTVGRH